MERLLRTIVAMPGAGNSDLNTYSPSLQTGCQAAVMIECEERAVRAGHRASQGTQHDLPCSLAKQRLMDNGM